MRMPPRHLPNGLEVVLCQRTHPLRMDVFIRGEHIFRPAVGGKVIQHEGRGRKVILARVQDPARIAGR